MYHPTIHSALSFPFTLSFARLLFALGLALGLLPSPLVWAQTGAGAPAAAQSDAEVRTLKVGEPVERELAGGEQHAYQITLSAGQFLHVIAEQRGIDVVMTLFGPDGKKLSEVDSPNGTRGPEPMMWIAEVAGTYRLEVRSLENNAAAGRYEAKIVALRTAGMEDRTLTEALRLYIESNKLRRQRKYDEAIPLAERALALRENTLWPDHPDTSAMLNLLASLHLAKRDYAKAEPLYQRALAINEKKTRTRTSQSC
jgi:tetratricopeptide (TPR) repeat protein